MINDNLNCDKCSRSLFGKGYTEIKGWKICGVCEWEKELELLSQKSDTLGAEIDKIIDSKPQQ